MTTAATMRDGRAGSAWAALTRFASAPASRGLVWILLLGVLAAAIAIPSYPGQDFLAWAATDPGASLRTDALVSAGKHPGVDFGYYYGLLPLLVAHVTNAVAGDGVTALCAMYYGTCAVIGVACVSVFWKYRPTRLATGVMACAIPHTEPVCLPTHLLEALLLLGGLVWFTNGRRRIGLACVSLALFAKPSMASVFLAAMIGLVVYRALLARSARPLRDLWVVPATVALTALVLGLFFGFDSLAAASSPSVGAGVYKASGFGFFRPSGLSFWWGHSAGWYLGTVAGIWLLATAAIWALAVRSAVKLVQSLRGGRALDEVDELLLIAALGQLGFVVAFFPGGAYYTVHYYTWLQFVALAPVVARAGRGDGRFAAVAPLGWAAVAGVAFLNHRLLLLPAIRGFGSPRAAIGSFVGDPATIAEWSAARDAAHRLGRVAGLGRGAHFSILDPSIREGPYWMLLPGLRQPKAIDATLAILRDSDAVIVWKPDVELLRKDPDARLVAWFDGAQPVLENKQFLVVRGQPSPAN